MFLDFQMVLKLNNFPAWFLLKGLSLLYSFLIRIWLYFYRSGIKKGFSAKIPVISIGNITVGGTGKTPMIDWCLGFCQKISQRPVVLTRGYKSETEEEYLILNSDTSSELTSEEVGDEPWLLFQKHPEVPFYIASDRVEMAKKADCDFDLILLDDGMQHLKLNRNLNLVLIDSTVGVENGQVLPLGPLREPLSSLKRADAIIYTRTNLRESAWVRKELAPFIPQSIPQFDSQYLPTRLLPSLGKVDFPLKELFGQACSLFSGIGNPDSFRMGLEKLGARVVNQLVLKDHQEYDDSLFPRLERFFQESSDSLIITTEKDWAKLEKWKKQLPIFHRIEMQVVMKEDFIEFFSSFFQSSDPS